MALLIPVDWKYARGGEREGETGTEQHRLMGSQRWMGEGQGSGRVRENCGAVIIFRRFEPEQHWLSSLEIKGWAEKGSSVHCTWWQMLC